MASNPWEEYSTTQPQKPAEAKAPWEEYAAPATPPWEEHAKQIVSEEPAKKAPWIWSDITTNKEIEDIAAKHKVDPQILKDAAAYFGATKEGESIKDLAKQAAGTAGEAVLFGAPQKLFKVAQTPEVERALDDLDKLAYEKKSTLRAGADIFGGLFTGGTQAKLLGKAALPVVGAVAGASHMPQGEELKGAAIGAVAAPVLGVAAEKGLKAVGKAGKYLGEKLGPTDAPEVARLTGTAEGVEDILAKKLAAGEGNIIEAEKAAIKSGKPSDLVDLLGEDKVLSLLNPSNKEYKYIRAELIDAGVEPTNKAIAEEFAKNKIESLRDMITKRVGADDWEKAVKENGGIDRLVNEVFPNARHEGIIKQAITEKNLGKNIEATPVLKGLLLKLSDNKPVMKMIDKKYGGASKYSAEQAVDTMSENAAKVSPVIKENLKQLETFDKTLKAAGVSREDFNDLYRSGEVSPALKQQWDAMTNGFLSEANKRGAGIQARADYMRDQIKEPAKLQGALISKVEELSDNFKTNIKDLSPDEWLTVNKSPSFKELKSAVDMLGGKPTTTVVEFTNSLKNVMDDTNTPYQRLASTLSAAREKTGSIPEFILEKDPIKALESWTTSLYKNLATREPLDRLRSIANIADEAGDSWTAKHLRDTIQDVLGGRKDSLAGGFKQAADKWSAYWHSKGQDTIAEMPEYYTALNRQIYPNMVGGLNIKAQLQNMSTPVLGAIPDVGIKEGTKAWWNSLSSVSNLFAKEGKAGAEKFLADRGIIPSNFHQDMAKLKATTGAAGRLNQKSNEALMYLFNMSEITARAQTYFMGQELGQKIAANPEWGATFISKVNSPAYRRTMSQALKAGDTESLQNQMSRYLNSNHLLNYDKANQSAFARYVGPTFSAFTKWPSTMLGKAMQEAEDKGIPAGSIEVAKKLMAPVMGLALVDHLARGENPSDRSKKILGTNLSEMAPGSSIGAIGKVMSPTSNIAGRFGEALSSSSKSDEHKIRKATNDVFSTFAPGAGWLKMLGSDLPTLITGTKPKGYAVESQVDTILGKKTK